MKTHNPASESVTVLLNQLYVATDLYKHEDSLNWSKLNHLLYVNAGLGAVFGFFLENNMNKFTNYIDPLLLIALVGMFVSFSFYVAIRSGVRYLEIRKKSVSNIDEKLKNLSECSVMYPNMLDTLEVDKNSPTKTVLLVFPLVLVLIWVAILCARVI